MRIPVFTNRNCFINCIHKPKGTYSDIDQDVWSLMVVGVNSIETGGFNVLSYNEALPSKYGFDENLLNDEKTKEKFGVFLAKDFKDFLEFFDLVREVYSKREDPDSHE